MSNKDEQKKVKTTTVVANYSVSIDGVSYEKGKTYEVDLSKVPQSDYVKSYFTKVGESESDDGLAKELEESKKALAESQKEVERLKAEAEAKAKEEAKSK